MQRAFFFSPTTRFANGQFADISGQFTNIDGKCVLPIITLAVGQTPELNVNGGSTLSKEFALVKLASIFFGSSGKSAIGFTNNIIINIRHIHE